MSLYTSSNPVQAGKRLVIRAAINADTLASPSIGAPTGTVTFTIIGSSGDILTCDSGSNVVTISTNAAESGLRRAVRSRWVSSRWPMGRTTVQASYSGDTNYASVAANTSVVSSPPPRKSDLVWGW